tara:strand:+ start:609 stop:920 length:312 start_codon:yes stop_codon:yes gene_type:complete
MQIRAMAMLLLLISFPAYAQDSADGQCRLTTLQGADAQEMMVKGVRLHTEFQKDPKDSDGTEKITIVHSIRADWKIWVCVQSLIRRGESPQSLHLVCTGCDYD